MSEKSIADIKEKLLKLIAKEESARKLGNLAEAEAFASHIQKLLLQYELDINSLKSEKAESVEVNEEPFDTSGLTGSHESNWVVYLYSALSASNFCRIIGHPTDQYKILIVGTGMNRELLHFVVAQLVIKLRTLSRDSWQTYEGTEKRNTFIRGFLKGACAGIRTRLAFDRRQEQQDSTQVNALVVQKMRSVDQFIQSKYTLVKGKSRKITGKDGWTRGEEAGKSVSINKGVSGSKPTKYLS